MFTPTRPYSQEELYVPLFVPPISPEGPIYSSFRAKPVPDPAQVATQKAILAVFHKKWPHLPEQVRASMTPPVPGLIHSRRIDTSDDLSAPAYNVSGYSSSDEEDSEEEVKTPSAFDPSMVKDAIKRHLKYHSGSGLAVAVRITVNPQLRRCIKDRDGRMDFPWYIITPRLSLANSIAPLDAMNAREIQALVQAIEQDNELVCERSTVVTGHEHVPLSRISLASKHRPVIAWHNAEPYGFKHQLHDVQERIMQRKDVGDRIKALLEEGWRTAKEVDSDNDSEDGILWMTKSKRSTK